MEIRTLQELFEEYRTRFEPERADGISGAIQLKLSGDDGGDWYMEVTGKELKIEKGIHGRPTATVSCRATDWIAISTGRANPVSMMFTGRLKVSGSVALATSFQHLFRTGD